MANKDKKLWIDGVLGSELKDTQGETLSVEGADISELEAGRGRWNDNHGKGFFNSLGTITEAKKIFKAEDCENERHKYFWEKIKAPYIYGKGYLHNDEDHPNAKAAAAIMRNIHRDDSPLKIKASVEGGVLARGIKDPTRLARTKIHSCAITFTPANNATLLEPLNLDKSNVDWEADKQLIKSVMHLAETNVPSFRHIQRHASANTIYDNIAKIQELAKSIGVEIEIKDANPDTIMHNAVLSKVSNNIQKINDLVKAVTSPGKVQMASQEKSDARMAAKDKYQQGISQLKSNPSTPAKPKSLDTATTDTMKVQNAAKVKSTNTLKSHASKAMRDPAHLDTVHSSLVDKGVHPDKATKIIGKIKSHMLEKSEDLEKGDIARAGKNLILAGALATGVSTMNPKDKATKPTQTVSREEKVKAHNAKIKDPQLHIDTAKDGYTQPKVDRGPASKQNKQAKRFRGEDAEYYNNTNAKMKARADKVKAKYSGAKSKLKKALTAGYGGAGAPTNLTSGGVFQAESLEDGRKTKKSDSGEFKYITCDNCGKEQVHMKHQVKCRECRQNFNLSKLEDLF